MKNLQGMKPPKRKNTRAPLVGMSHDCAVCGAALGRKGDSPAKRLETVDAEGRRRYAHWFCP